MSWIIVLVLFIGLAALVSYVRGTPPATVAVGQMKAKGDGSFSFDIVGESHYQKNLAAIAGDKTGEEAQHLCKATFVLENSNSYDSQAVRVDIEGRTVGYLSREQARIYRKNLKREGSPERCDAMIVGGWKRGSDEGYFGVKLDL